MSFDLMIVVSRLNHEHGGATITSHVKSYETRMAADAVFDVIKQQDSKLNNHHVFGVKLYGPEIPGVKY